MEPGGEPSEEALLAEREEILRQLAELGSDSEDEEPKEEAPDNSETPEIEEKPVECPVGEKSPEKSPETKVARSGSSSSNSGANSAAEGRRTPPIPIEKIVLDRLDKEKGPLPHGWTAISHNSGMIVYYHKFTQVVTHSRPYQVEGTVRDHEIPISSIPCLFRKIMDEKHEELAKIKKEKAPESEENVENPEIEIPEEEKKLNPEQFRSFCEKRFKFKKIIVHRYANSAEKDEKSQQKRMNSILKRKGFEMDYDQLLNKQEPGDVLLCSDSGGVLIDLTPFSSVKQRCGTKKPFLLNPMAKTTVAVLNEIIQRLAKGDLTYDITDNRNASSPYKAVAILSVKAEYLEELTGHIKETLVVLSETGALKPEKGQDVPKDRIRFAIGCGVGGNKKTARLVAAREGLTKLLPKLRFSNEHVCTGLHEEGQQKGYEEESRELFKQVKIDSSNLVALCSRFAIPKPHGLLREAVNRSLRWNGMELKMHKEMVAKGSQWSKVVLKLGDMEQEAVAIGLKPALHLASQLLFKQMHPELLYYGSFLEMYGRLEDKSRMEKAKKQHDEVVRLSDTGNLLEPNFIVLGKLSEEMKAMSVVHPPRKFLYGIAHHAAGSTLRHRMVGVQTSSESPQSIGPSRSTIPPLPYFMPQPPMPPPFAPAPHGYGEQFHHRNPRKRERQEDGPPNNYFPPRPPPHY